MKITTITAGYRRVINLGNFESVAIEEHVEAELEPGEDVEAARAALWAMVKGSVKSQAMPVIKAKADEISAIRASLPAGTVD